MRDSEPTARSPGWLRRPTIIVAWAVLLLAIVHPPDGLGIPVCLTAAITGVPCPGCGLTRSISCAIRGMFTASCHYHPFGIVFLAMLAGAAAVSLMPTRVRRRIDSATGRHAKAMNVAYNLLIAVFLAFGVARAAVHYLHRW